MSPFCNIALVSLHCHFKQEKNYENKSYFNGVASMYFSLQCAGSN